MYTALIYTIISFIASCICGWFTIPVVLDFCKRKGLYDIPNQRKVHKNAVPRLGGVVFMPCVFFGSLAAFTIAYVNGIQTITLSLWTVYFIVSITAIYITGLVDDIVGLSAITKLIVQLIAATMLPLSGLWLNNLYGLFGIYEIPYWVGVPLTIVAITFISNAINLIDGIDGLSGGLTLIALSGFIVAFCKWHLWTYVVIIAALMGVIAAYLYYNIWGDATKNRKIFMGDTGSLSIGFLLAFLCIKLSMSDTGLRPYNGNGLLLSFTVIIVPVFDVFRVALLRITHHRSPMTPDKNHIHHKLLRTGANQSQVLVVVLSLQAFLCLVNYLLSQLTGITVIVLTDIVLYIAFHLCLNRMIIRRGEKPHLFQDAKR